MSQKSVKKLRNGCRLVESATEKHYRNFLRSKILCNVPMQVPPHVSCNTSKGLIKSRDLEGVSEQEICEISPFKEK